MDALAAAAEAAAEAQDDGPSPEDDYDPLRGQLPSDDEEGPAELDAELDALPRGDVDAAGEAIEDDDAAEASAGAEPQAGAFFFRASTRVPVSTKFHKFTSDIISRIRILR